jgi:ATP synthase protein I
MEQPAEKPKKQSFNTYIKFSGIGLQMAATIAILAWLGHLLDGHFHTRKPLITLAFMLIGTFFSIYSLIKQLNQMN